MSVCPSSVVPGRPSSVVPGRPSSVVPGHSVISDNSLNNSNSMNKINHSINRNMYNLCIHTTNF